MLLISQTLLYLKVSFSFLPAFPSSLAIRLTMDSVALIPHDHFYADNLPRLMQSVIILTFFKSSDVMV